MAPPPSVERTGVSIGAALVPLPLTIACMCAGFALSGPSSSVHAIEEGGWGASLAIAAALFSALVATPLVLLAPRVPVPAVIAASIATVPWLVGLAGAVSGARIVASVIGTADAAVRASIVAQGLAELLQARIVGSAAAAAVLSSVALALAIASLRPRAEQRSALGALLGGFAALAALGVALGSMLMGQTGLGASLPLVATCVIAALSLAIAGFGAGADPEGRSASLAASSGAVSVLAVAAAGACSATLPVVELFGALANVEASMRDELLARGFDELAWPAALARYAWVAASLGALVVVGWSALRSRPTPGRIAAGALLGVLVLALPAVDALGESSAQELIGGAMRSPWEGRAAFTPMDPGEHARAAGDIDVFVTTERIELADGSRGHALGELEGSGRAAIVELLGAAGRDEGYALDDYGWGSGAGSGSPQRELVVALDARTSGATLRALLGALGEAGVARVQLAGRHTGASGALEAHVPVAFRFLTFGVAAIDAELAGARSDDEHARDPRLLHARVAGAAGSPLVVHARQEEPVMVLAPGGPALSGGEGSLPPLAGGTEPIYLMIDPTASLDAVVSALARVHDAERTPILLAGDAVPGDPTRPFAELPLEGQLTGEPVGLGSLGTIGDRSEGAALSTGAPEVTGSLPADVIRRVVRRHMNEVRFCYERGLAQRPGLAGRVELSWVIDAAGSVISAEVSSSTLDDEEVERCIVGSVRRWTFPSGGGLVRVRFPFVFAASEQ